MMQEGQECSDMHGMGTQLKDGDHGQNAEASGL